MNRILRLTRAGLTEGAEHLRRSDPLLGTWIERIGPVPLRRQSHHFGALCRSIIAQQLAASAAATIHRRFLTLFAPARRPSPAGLLEIDGKQLRSVGLSERKASFLRSLARAFHEGPLRDARLGALPDGEVIETLVALPGIGRWTAEMFLIFGLGRQDVFSVGDLALRTGVQRVVGRKLAPEAIERVAARWSPYRSVASLYLWRVAHWQA